MEKKTTMQDIADILGISRVTVWKALKNQSGVSETIYKKVWDKAAQLGYISSSPLSNQGNQKSNGLTVSVVVSRPESSMFWTRIIHCIAKELAQYQINLLYTYVPFSYERSYQLPNSLVNGTIQGAIILNVYDEQMLRMIDSLPIPKVYLDTVTAIPPIELKGDTVLLEGFESIKKITGDILDRGRHELGFIGDIGYARTNYDRYAGFLDAFSSRDLSVNPKFCLTDSLGIKSYYDRITEFLNNLKTMPQGFICASDDVASFLRQYLKSRGYSVPQDVCVSGYDGSSEYDSESFLTTVVVDANQLGKRLVKQLQYRMDNAENSYELIYISSSIRYGQSTNFQ